MSSFVTDNSNEMKFGLLWHSITSDNLGVGALTFAHIKILENVCAALNIKPKFVILGWKDKRAAYLDRDDLEVVELRLKDFVKPIGGLLGHLRNCDVVFDISAGDSFTDIYGTKRIGTMLGAKWLTHVACRPLVLCPQTIGPFNRPWALRAALGTIRRSAVAATRDDLSTDFLRNSGYDGPLIAASDVALRLPYENTNGAENGRLKVGLNVSGLLFNGGYDRDNMFGLKTSYAHLIQNLLERLTLRNDLEVHLVPHVISDHIEVEDDYRVSQKLAKAFPSLVVSEKFNNPVEAKTYISGMDFFAGARMHACIAAFSSGVPVLPMAYSRKFAGLFGALGYDLIADCQSEGAEQIIDKFDKALQNREELANKTQECLQRGLERLQLYEDAVSEQLQAVMSHSR